MKWMLTTLTVMAMAALTSAGAHAQDAATKSRAAAASDVQTDVGLSGYATFTGATTGGGTQQNPTNSFGGMIEGRQIRSNWLGYEMAVNYNEANQKYAPATNCLLACKNPTAEISGKAVEVSGDYIASYKVGNLRPFVVGGLGVFITIPGATPYGNNTSIRGAYIAGGGLDYNFGQHLGIRLQVRDTFYKAPNISSIYPATGQLASTLEPMGGVYWRF